MPYFILKSADEKPAIVAIETPIFKIGRVSGCDLILNHPAVSRLHARVRMDGTDAFLIDSMSRNGTAVNNVRVHGEQRLFDGDVITICNMHMEFYQQLPVGLENPDRVPSAANQQKR